MPTEIQIVNRSTSLAKRIVAKLRDEDTGDSFMEFLIRPGQAVILPVDDGMCVTIAEEHYVRAEPLVPAE